MEGVFAQIAGSAALTLEACCVIVIAVGGVEAVWRLGGMVFRRDAPQGIRRVVWLSFGRWLLLGLEFTLAADIIRSTLTPDWDDIARLAAITAIRTFFGFFLERDLKEANVPPEQGVR